jgi:hypothetical protein
MRTAYELYQVSYIKHNSGELTIEAANRRGRVFVAHLKRTDERYWEGSTDFNGLTDKKTFKGIVNEFLQALVSEVREYDRRWYDLHCVVRVIDNGKRRPLTWEETAYGSFINEAEPVFKGGVKFKTNN